MLLANQSTTGASQRLWLRQRSAWRTDGRGTVSGWGGRAAWTTAIEARMRVCECVCGERRYNRTWIDFCWTCSDATSVSSTAPTDWRTLPGWPPWPPWPVHRPPCDANIRTASIQHTSTTLMNVHCTTAVTWWCRLTFCIELQ